MKIHTRVDASFVSLAWLAVYQRRPMDRWVGEMMGSSPLHVSSPPLQPPKLTPTPKTPPRPQLVLGTIELDESKICTCLAISDNVNGGSGGPSDGGSTDVAAPELELAPPMPAHIMPGGGRGGPIA